VRIAQLEAIGWILGLVFALPAGAGKEAEALPILELLSESPDPAFVAPDLQLDPTKKTTSEADVFSHA